MDYGILGKRIRDERLLLRLTMEQLAERIDKSLNFIGQIERGESKPSLETVSDIANALGITIDSLLVDKKNNDNTNCEYVNTTIRAIDILLNTMDDRGQQFILDMVKRYSYHHKQGE